MAHPLHSSFSMIDSHLTTALLQFYDYPDPKHPTRMIEGYDKPHALRTAWMCTTVAQDLGYQSETLQSFHIACLLHDLGRAGLDHAIFSQIWSWAKNQNIPTRPGEWRARFPATPYGKETEAFVARYQVELEKQGISIDPWTIQQIEMRLGFARRLKRQLRRVKPALAQIGVQWAPWMGKIMLYYYYPETFARSPRWIRQLGEILVACEQLEAYSNRQRGKDYYTRSQEQFEDAFAFLEALTHNNILTRIVVNSVKKLTATGTFDHILQSARGKKLSKREITFLRSLNT